ncbi:hypothetical protein EI555_019936 [Monodon monoceros]|uniref:ABC transporter domain-containing protein n=1 Tax=Monodon monoceros TaxID=40151 RepID=A0A4U1FMZ8_MONMO|nr:hypothetical protein EI555_019936 [Monodon monoceros]
MTMFRNLKLLLWKNFILKKPKTLVTVLEILMPLLFSAIVMYLHFGSLPRNRPPVNYCAIDITSLPEFFIQYPLKNRFQLVYIPSKSETLKSITESVEKTFGVEFEGYPSVPSFENYIIQDPKAFYVLTGIGFDHGFNDSKEPLPLEVKYYLRFSSFQRNYLFLRLILHEDDFQGWSTSYLYPPNLSQEPWDYGLSDGGSPGYNKGGFLAIQHATDKAIMWHHAPNETTKLFESLIVLLKRFPHGAYVQDSFFLVLQNEFPLFLMLSFIYIELTTINSIALEKERKLKEFMCMMGLHNWQHWVAWFTIFSISAFIVVSFMTILFCTKVNDVAVFKNSDPSLIFVFLMYFAIATIFFAFMISTFFQKAHVAAASRGIIFFFTYLPYLYLAFSYNQRSHFQKIAFCLLSSVAMALGVRLISTYETKVQSSHWLVLQLFDWKVLVTFLCLRCGDCFPSFGVGTGIQWRNMGSAADATAGLLNGLVAWYVESVFPGVYGTPKPWYFFLMPSYWRGEPISFTNSVLELGDPQKALKSKFIQEEPTDLIKGIEIQHLYKVFYKGRDEHMAVKDLTINLYRGQITVLLGHNGAGKTTTCGMLTDMCLKDLLRQKCPEEIKRVLHILSLEDKRDSRSRFLSGGMRHKLSIGIALIGITLIAGSKVLMLDEPTSGVDAISRRAIWDLPQQHKSDRTILLTTHFVDEANLLGDHIAIMAKGELQCCGSSLFLKQKYGAGYYMTLVKKPHCNMEKISHLIYQHTPNAIFQSSTGEEITFILPKESVHKFESLFTDLELRQEELGIAGFGASVTTMEEVFIRVSKLVDSSIDMQIIKLPSFHSHPLVSRVPVNRIKRLNSRIFSIQSSLPIQPNTGVSKYFKCMQESRFLFHSWNHDIMLSRIQPSLPTVLCHVLEKGYIFLVQLDDDAVNTDPGTSGDPYGQPLIPQLQYKHGKCPIGVDSKKHMLSEHFTDMLMAEEQIPLQLLSKYQAQENGAGSRPIAPCIEPFLLKKLEEEPEVFDKNYLVAASFEDMGNHTIVTALFNNQAYHSPALALALVDNVPFKLLSGARASIMVFNHPQPQSNKETSENILYEYVRLSFPPQCFSLYHLLLPFFLFCFNHKLGPKGHYLVINLLFGMAFLSSSFSILTVKERCIKTKQVQFISGVYVATFWLSALLWDLISFLIPTLLLLVVFLYYDEEAFTHPENIPALVLMLMLYASIIPFIYLTSFCFDNAGSACVKLIITLTFLNIGPLVLVSVTSEKGHCLGMAFSNLYYNFELQTFCNAKSLNQTECNQVRQWIGYSPQFDALLDHMTDKETLLRGIPKLHISACVDQILDDLLMYTYADNLVKTYSGGNKRKLSTGTALLGEPTVIFLDEPSTGMDPVARSLLWGTVARACKSGKAIVITSHSMEDCEALCTWLAIMVQGQFKCLGSPQHLKSQFGSGYSLRAKIWSDRQQEALEEFKAFVDLTFPGPRFQGPGPPSPGHPARPSGGHCAGSVLEDEHQGMVHYYLPGNDLSWAKVFGILEQAKKKYMLEDFSVNQISLEDIFLSFTCPVPPNQRENKQAKAEPAGPFDSATEPGVSSPEARAGRRACGFGPKSPQVEDHVGVPAPIPWARRRGRSAQTFTDKPLHAVASGRRDLLPPSQPQGLSPEQARSTRAGADSETLLQPGPEPRSLGTLARAGEAGRPRKLYQSTAGVRIRILARPIASVRA